MSLYPITRPEERESIPTLIRQLFLDLRELIQQHIELTKAEVRIEGQRLLKAVVLSLLGLVSLQVFLIFLGILLLLLLVATNRMSILGATMTMASAYFVLTILFFALTLQQIRSVQKDISP